ncbi:MAG: TVP38/TMEM64 family protein [Bacilli bacterium]|jgi:uncharacterized membrane protein YdjX (TVP38/TMEM64 family)
MSNNIDKKTKIKRILIFIGVYILIGLLLLLLARIFNFNTKTIRDAIDKNRGNAYFVFMGLQLLANIVFMLLPGTTFTQIVIGLAFFTPLETFVMVSVVTLIISILYYIVGRFFSNFISNKILDAQTKDRYIRAFQRKTRVYYPLVMLLPFFPDDQLTMVAGMAKMDVVYFLITTLICRSVGIGVICYFGGAIPWYQLSTEEIILFIFIAIFGILEMFTIASQIDKNLAKRH